MDHLHVMYNPCTCTFQFYLCPLDYCSSTSPSRSASLFSCACVPREKYDLMKGMLVAPALNKSVAEWFSLSTSERESLTASLNDELLIKRLSGEQHQLSKHTEVLH